MAYTAGIRSAVLFQLVCITDTSLGCSCMHQLELIKQVTMAEKRRLLLCHIPPAPNAVTTLALLGLTCPEPVPPLTALCQAGGWGGPTKPNKD